MSKREKLIHVALLCLGLTVLGYAFFGEDGVPEVTRLKGQVRVLNEELRQLEARQGELERQISKLRNDPRAIERVAREKLKMVRPEETVILLDGNPDDR